MNKQLEEIKLKSEDRKWNFSGIYTRLSFIINRARNIFSNKKTELKSDNNISVMNEPLKPDSIIEIKPELAKDVFATFNEALKSDKNDYNSLRYAYSALGNIAKAQPELAKDVLATFNEAFKSDKNNYNFLKNVYSLLSDIAKAQPELANNVVNSIIFQPNNIGKIRLLSLCMKNCRPENFPEANTEQKQ